MRDRVRTSLLWGTVGVLTFLVILQATYLLGYTLATVPRAIASVIAVFAATSVLAYALEGRFQRRNQRP